MKVQRISAATPISHVATLQKTQQTQNKETKVTNPISENSSKASEIIRNYFLGSQMVNPSFTGFPCATSNFKIKELEDMPCTCCGRPMMTNEQISKFADEASQLHGKRLNDYLNENMDYFRAEEKAVVHYIQKQLKRMPDATLTTAVSRTQPSAEKVLRDEQIDVLNRTSEKSKELLGEKNPVQLACEYELSTKFGIPATMLKETKFNPKAFNRTVFLETLTRVEKKNNLEHDKMHKILDIAVQIPESEKAISKMLFSYANSNDRKFANRLIQKTVVTAEHIHPKSKGGPNATDNYMGECQECNSSRGNMSYGDWMRRYPNMPDNIQVNINAVTEEIIKGKIGGNYDDYPVDLKTAIAKETSGKVQLKVKNPEEIDAIRDARGLAKPAKDLNELKYASTNTYQYKSNKDKTENADNKQEVRHSKKSKNKKHGKILRFPEQTIKTEDSNNEFDKKAA